MATLISWTNETWNPVTGCHKVSEGCRYCYAESLSLKFGWSKKPWTLANANENVICHPERLGKPFTWKKPSRVFVNSMSDIFHENIPESFIHDIFDVMEKTSQHTYQILTKRPERLEKWKRFPDNVWFGTTVENEKVSWRIDAIKQSGAKIKFISCEPLIGEIKHKDFSGIDWIIVGGESGIHLAKAEKIFKEGGNPREINPRWMDMAWARNLRDIAVEIGAAYFFKQDSGVRTEMRPYLIEIDGSKWKWSQYPGHLTDPVKIS